MKKKGGSLKDYFFGKIEKPKVWSDTKSYLKYLKNKPKKWHHLAFNCKEGVPKVYLDGKLFNGTYEFWRKS